MITKPGWDQNLMLSLHKKEATYGAAVSPVNATNFCSIKGEHPDFNPDFADKVESDKPCVTGTEYGTDQFILERGFKYPFSSPNVKPNTLIGLVALAEGSITSVKDGANDGYTHDISEIAAGTALPSINVIAKKGGKQYLFPGVKSNGYEIKGEESKAVSFSSDLIGSGARTVNADSFVAAISESWMLMNPSTIKMTSGADIDIDAVLTQGLQNISATTPTNLSASVKAFTFKRVLNMIEQRMGGDGYCADIHYARRAVECSINLRYADYISLYEAQTPMAVELDCKQGGLIDPDGTLCYGFKIVIPRGMLKKFPYPTGGVNDELVMAFELDIQNDATHKPFYIQAYNKTAIYLAA